MYIYIYITYHYSPWALQGAWVFCCLFGVCLFVCLFVSLPFSVFVWWLVGVGWGGMLTFMFMLRWWCYVDHRVGGVGWDANLHVQVVLMMLRWSWGGMGWDANVHVHVTLMMLRWSWGGRGGMGWDGVVRGGMLTFLFMLRWNCSMVEVVFGKWKNSRARLHAQLHWGSARNPP